MVVIIVLADRLVEKSESTGTVQNVAVPVRKRSARRVENIAAAEASVEESPNVSLSQVVLKRWASLILAYMLTKSN